MPRTDSLVEVQLNRSRLTEESIETIDTTKLDDAEVSDLAEQIVEGAQSNRGHMRDKLQERVEFMTAKADVARALIGIGVGGPYSCMNIVGNMDKKSAQTLATALRYYIEKL